MSASRAGRQRMKAVVQDGYGESDVLELREIDIPSIGRGEVLVEVRATAVDNGVWHLMTGVPYATRIFGFGLRAPKQPVRGLDLAGVVVALGADASGFDVGDEVFGTGTGTFAEYAVSRPELLAPKPSGVTFEQAAAAPNSAFTALQALRDAGRLVTGQRVLVIGANGGVGSFAVQIAVALGAVVTGVCRGTNTAMVRSLGASEVIDYEIDDCTDGTRTWDLILDTGGNRPVDALRRALTPTGTLVIVGSETDGRWLGGTGRQMSAQALSPLIRQNLVGVMAKPNHHDLSVIATLLASGEVVPQLGDVFPLAEAAAAVDRVRAGDARGKVILVP